MKKYNVDAELSAIMTVLKSSNKDLRVKALSRLERDLFGYGPTRELFKRIQVVAQSSGSIPSRRVFKNDPALSDKARAFLDGTLTVTPLETDSDLDHLMTNLDTYRKVRVAADSIKRMTDMLTKETLDSNELSAAFEDTLMSLRKTGASEAAIYHSGNTNNSDDVMEAIISSTDNKNFIPTGFKNFDLKTGGWRRGDMVVIASHYKGGKSVVKLNLLNNMYRQSNLSVCDVSLEMNESLEYSRVASMISGIEYSKVYNNVLSKDEKSILRKAWAAHKQHGIDNNCKFSIWPASYINPTQIEMILKPYKFDVIAVDYLNLLAPENGRQVDPGQLGEWCKQLKRVAGRLNCVVIVLTQMDENTGDIRYFRAAQEDANNLWLWKYDDFAKTTHILKVQQKAARSHQPFDFELMEDYSRMKIVDNNTAMVTAEDELCLC